MQLGTLPRNAVKMLMKNADAVKRENSRLLKSRKSPVGIPVLLITSWSLAESLLKEGCC